MTKSLKNVKNEKCTLKDLEYGEKTKEDLILFLEEGCDRIGTSSAVGMLQGGQAQGY